MLEKWKSVLDEGECLLFIYGKLKAYGFSDKSLALMYSYLKNKKNRTQISNYLS